MWRVNITLVLSLWLASVCSAQDFDSLLFAGYVAESDSLSWQAFSEAQSMVNSTEREAQLAYFRYFYHYRFDAMDSIDYYESRALKLLKETGKWLSYFKLCNNRYYFIEESGSSEKAIIFAKQTLKEATAVGNYKYMATMHSCIGNSYHNISFYEKGIKEAKLGRDLILNHLPEDEGTLSEALNIIAINFDDWNKPDSAIFYHRKVLALENISELEKGSTYNNIGNTFMKLAELDSADKYISKALELRIRENSFYGMATTYNNKADIFLRREEYESCKSYLDSALKYAKKSNAIEKKRDVHDTWNRYYLALDSHALALYHSELFHAYKDSMVNVEKIQVIENLEKDSLELEQKKALNKRNFWIVLFSAATVILLLVMRQLIQKRKRLQEEAKLQVQEERLRISRDLHDNIGAELSYMSSLIDQKLYGEENEEKRAELSELGNSSKSAMNQLRETIWAIQTEEITLQKFKEKLEQLSRRYSENLQINVKVTFEGENHLLNPVQAINIFRISQEAINNAFKYAKEKEVTVSINGEEDHLIVSIQDNGVGFDRNNIKKGYGLNNMQERAEQMNGVLSITSSPNTGTVVKVQVPLVSN